MSAQSDAFVRQMEALVAQFEARLSEPEWLIRRDPKRMRDEDGQVFTATALTIFHGAMRLLLDPTAYDIPGAEVAVDLYLLPPYDPVATLYLEEGQWFIHSPYPCEGEPSAGFDRDDWQRSALDEETLGRVLGAIADHAVPSV